MAIKNAYTSKTTEKSVGLILKAISSAGAKSSSVHNDEAGVPVSITFKLQVGNQVITYLLDSRYEGVRKTFERDKVKTKGKLDLDEQATRTAWAIMSDWVQAQLAIIDAGMAVLAEVMLPFAINEDGQTLWQAVESGKSKLKLLPEGGARV